MTDEHVDLNAFAVALLEAGHRTLGQATDGLNDEQLYHQPTPDANSIGWLAWHLSRWMDRYGAIVSGDPHVWESGGWAERFGMDAARTGKGDSLEQVAAFHPARELLFGYVDAAHQAAVEIVGQISAERFLAPFQSVAEGPPPTAWQVLVGSLMDMGQHTGQIAYLRGMITGYGWRTV